ncbi:ATP-binding protein [Streptomyces californicus]|uniref:ATP-binding protein n=1 Tax=Streptomyces californicus TaxID=67351 RepID=UPI003722A49F
MSLLATRLVLMGREEEVSIARRSVVERVRAWGFIDEETTETIRLIISELVSNAVVHGEGPVTITVLGRPSGLLIDVRDGNHEAPRTGSFGTENEHGRGLALVDALAVRSGWRVWAEVALPRVRSVGSRTPCEQPLRPAV